MCLVACEITYNNFEISLTSGIYAKYHYKSCYYLYEYQMTEYVELINKNLAFMRSNNQDFCTL